MTLKRRATAIWKGTGPDGNGSLSSISEVLNETPYSAALRFQNEDGKKGTNPEELIAAAHAGCYAMALSFQLTNEGFTPTSLKTEAIVSMEKGDSGWSITKIDLNLEGIVEGVSEDKFLELAENAKKGCPVSKALSAVEIELHARLS